MQTDKTDQHLKFESFGKQKDSLSAYCHGVTSEVKNSQTEQSEPLNETDTKLSDYQSS